MTDTKPTAAEQAAEHLIEKLQQMHADAMRVAETQDAAAEGTNNYKRQIGYEESAAFHRALASEIDEVLHKLRTRAKGEPELEWGVRSTNRATGRTEDVPQPSEVSARSRVVCSVGASVLICRAKAGKWREAEPGA